MPYLLRAIYSNTKWEGKRFPPWLPAGELPSCIIKDLNANDNALSVWEIPDDKANLDSIIAAIASSYRKLFKNDFDYALLDVKYVDQISFNTKDAIGDTPYSEMNHYHRNLSNLTLNTVVRFASILQAYGLFDRMGWKKLEALIKDAHKNQQLDLEIVKPELKEQLILTTKLK